MSIFKIISIFWITMSYTNGISQVVNTDLKSVSDIVAYTEQLKKRHTVVEGNYNSKKIEFAVDSTNVLSATASGKKTLSPSTPKTNHTSFTLNESSLRIHQVTSRNRVITVNDVKLIEDVKFYDHVGRLVGTVSNIQPKNNAINLDLSAFEKGIYFLKFKNHRVIKRISIK